MPPDIFVEDSGCRRFELTERLPEFLLSFFFKAFPKVWYFPFQESCPSQACSDFFFFLAGLFEIHNFYENMVASLF